MGVRMDASGDSLSRTAANIVVDHDTFTFTIWAKRKVDTGAFSTVFYCNGDAGQECWLETETGGDVLHLFDLSGGSESDLTGPTMTIDTWFFLVFRRNSDTSRDLLYGTEAGGTLTKVAQSGVTRAHANDMDALWIGNDIYTEPFNGEFSYARLWSSALTDGELDSEWRSTTPVKSGVRGDWRLTNASSAGTDSSGNSLTLTVGGTLADAGDPTPPSSSGGRIFGLAGHGGGLAGDGRGLVAKPTLKEVMCYNDYGRLRKAA